MTRLDCKGRTATLCIATEQTSPQWPDRNWRVLATMTLHHAWPGAGTDNAGTRHPFGHDHCDIDVLNRREDARRNEEDKPTDVLGAS